MLAIKEWLENTSLKVAEERFLKPPPLPYVIFTEYNEISGADNKNSIATRDISIEFYSVAVDRFSEGLIETLLNEKAINYTKDRLWIDTEMMFETVFNFTLTEKF